MGRKKNIESIAQILILLAIACLLIAAMISKKISYYVHPRFYLGIWFSIVILILFAISLVSKVKKARHNVNLRHYIIFVIPLAAALLFPTTGVSNKGMTLANSNFIASSRKQNKINNKTNIASTGKDNTNASAQETQDANSTAKETSDISEKYKKYEKNGVMVINDNIFAEWYGDVYDYLDTFKGKKCKYLAQVYSMKDYKKNQFMAGRYFMVCCAADLVGYGITCESDKRSELKDEEWITVEGTIDEYKYKDSMVPLLKNVTITKAKKPDVTYIYYNNY